jgi:hypothetical protein
MWQLVTKYTRSKVAKARVGKKTKRVCLWTGNEMRARVANGWFGGERARGAEARKQSDTSTHCSAEWPPWSTDRVNHRANARANTRQPPTTTIQFFFHLRFETHQQKLFLPHFVKHACRTDDQCRDTTRRA